MAQKKSKRTCPSEASEQIRLFNWLRKNNILSFAIPNGFAARNKRNAQGMVWQGMTKGTPDLMIPIARQGKHGLFIEMKALDTFPSDVSPEQRYMLGQLKNQGYLAVVCKGEIAAREVICEYLEISDE